MEMSPEQRAKHISGVVPWRRYFARMLDLNIFTLVVAFIAGSVFPDVGEESFLIVWTTFGSILAMPFVESFLMQTGGGATPGKRLLGITVSLESGEEPTYMQLVKRNFKAMALGFGLGVPLVSLVTLVISYNKLNTDVITPWDRSGGFIVSSIDVDRSRYIIVGVLLVVILSIRASLV